MAVRVASECCLFRPHGTIFGLGQANIRRSPEQVADRLDRLIADLRKRFHEPAFRGEVDQPDVVIVAHGHILRAFAMRWIGKGFDKGVSFILEGMSP